MERNEWSEADVESAARAGDALARAMAAHVVAARDLTIQILAERQVSSDVTFSNVEALRIADHVKAMNRAGARNDWPAMDEADERLQACIAEIVSRLGEQS